MSKHGKKGCLGHRYSIARIRMIFKDVYGLTVVKRDLGYKGNRHVPYCLYDLVTPTGEVILENITLNAMGDFLASQNEY